MLFCGIKFDKKFACLCFKFIKEILGWMSLNLLNFISRFLSKKCFLSAREILGFARSLAGFCHLALLCRSCKRYENFSLTMHLLQISSSSNKPRIDCTTRAIEQNIHRMLHSKNFQFYCSNLATPPFAAVSALLTKFLLNALKKWSARHPSEI